MYRERQPLALLLLLLLLLAPPSCDTGVQALCESRLMRTPHLSPIFACRFPLTVAREPRFQLVFQTAVQRLQQNSWAQVATTRSFQTNGLVYLMQCHQPPAGRLWQLHSWVERIAIEYILESLWKNATFGLTWWLLEWRRRGTSVLSSSKLNPACVVTLRCSHTLYWKSKPELAFE